MAKFQRVLIDFKEIYADYAYNIKNNSRKPRIKKAPSLTNSGAFGYCLLTDTGPDL